MNKTIYIAAIAIILATTALSAQTRTTPQQQIASMKWIAGTWEGPMWGDVFRAYYTAPEGGKVISHNLLIKKGKSTSCEFDVFQVEGGKVVFNPYPSGKKLTTLTLTQCIPAEMRVVFENPTKDYPTRIEYHRQPCRSGHRPDIPFVPNRGTIHKSDDSHDNQSLPGETTCPVGARELSPGSSGLGSQPPPKRRVP